MPQSPFIIMTSINYPTTAVKKIAELCPDWRFVVVGDRKTPADWQWEGVEYLSASDQLQMDLAFAEKCPFNHYARKNVGYLHAIHQKATLIAETDDDNIPYDTFLQDIQKDVTGQRVTTPGWENVYRHFTQDKIWPRGLPLEVITAGFKAPKSLGPVETTDCPIQQYLADGDPDVDAVYRLTIEAETKFERNTILLPPGTYCPFNSQNTIWWPETFPLLYLPSYVSFRMTDIWRSFIAQICLYRMGKCLAFKEATVFQERNEHSLIKDFKDEVPGYLNNARILVLLSALDLSPDPAHAGRNLRACYVTLIDNEIVPPEELPLVDLWLEALA